MPLTTPGPEYRWAYSKGDARYKQPNPTCEYPFYLRRPSKPGPRRGKVCPGCGLERSLMNKCECNE